jgi:hypothetical protein
MPNSKNHIKYRMCHFVLFEQGSQYISSFQSMQLEDER